MSTCPLLEKGECPEQPSDERIRAMRVRVARRASLTGKAPVSKTGGR